MNQEVIDFFFLFIREAESLRNKVINRDFDELMLEIEIREQKQDRSPITKF